MCFSVWLCVCVCFVGMDLYPVPFGEFLLCCTQSRDFPFPIYLSTSSRHLFCSLDAGDLFVLFYILHIFWLKGAWPMHVHRS